ncbi:hypothetical protein LCGC14_0144900 [marine sediment metagenome]|uniref:Uncharacterized protein n=1 Tax=marine sediment metagenome TaxID=412755 RepID=A0A0F9Y182_9ZZZZ
MKANKHSRDKLLEHYTNTAKKYLAEHCRHEVIALIFPSTKLIESGRFANVVPLSLDSSEAENMKRWRKLFSSIYMQTRAYGYVLIFETISAVNSEEENVIRDVDGQTLNILVDVRGEKPVVNEIVYKIIGGQVHFLSQHKTTTVRINPLNSKR